MTGEPAALVVEGIGFTYGRQKEPALVEVGFTAPGGAVTALLGPNGAGKTTLMALITRLFQADRGRIEVCGHDLGRSPRAALSAIGVVFQQPTLDLDLTVEQNLHYGAALQGLPKAVVRDRIAATLDELRLTERRQTKLRALSGGLKRRVEIGRALLHRPRLLVLDEPTVGLDIESRGQLVETVHGMCQAHGLAVLWATHLIDEVWHEDRLVVLHQGRVRAAGGVADVVAEAGAPDLTTAFKSLVKTS